MAGRGPAPKPAAIRQRRNKKPGAVELEAAARSVRRPRLPVISEIEWHELTKGWWANVWASPMADQYLDVDVDGLVRLALIVNHFYTIGDPKLLAEIRLQEARFGLSPLDRTRLQWEISRTDESKKKRSSKPATAEEMAGDPRLRLVQ